MLITYLSPIGKFPSKLLCVTSTVTGVQSIGTINQCVTFRQNLWKQKNNYREALWFLFLISSLLKVPTRGLMRFFCFFREDESFKGKRHHNQDYLANWTFNCSSLKDKKSCTAALRSEISCLWCFKALRTDFPSSSSSLSGIGTSSIYRGTSQVHSGWGGGGGGLL